MKKVICLILVALLVTSATWAFAESQSSSSGESKWTKAYVDIANWEWGGSSKFGGTKKASSGSVKKKATEVSPKN